VSEITERVLAAFKDTLMRETPWVSRFSRGRLLAKADNVIFHIGYPDVIFNRTAVDNAFRSVRD
jgi:predicted metalloendopeptidase